MQLLIKVPTFFNIYNRNMLTNIIKKPKYFLKLWKSLYSKPNYKKLKQHFSIEIYQVNILPIIT